MKPGSDGEMEQYNLVKWKTEGSYDFYFVYSDENPYNEDFDHTYYVVKLVTATNAIADVYSCTRWSTGNMPGTLYQGSAYDYSGLSAGQSSGSGSSTKYFKTQTFKCDYSLAWITLGNPARHSLTGRYTLIP